MKYFIIAKNPELSGTIPPELGSFTHQLINFYIHTTKVSGTIPHTLGKLTSAQRFYLHTNKLSGTIPNSLRHVGTNVPANKPSEKKLYLNKLTGP